ncbi:MAG TPA: hypothetical protein VLE02_05200 [Nitrosarchaeum sp.]|nr:hypothetical protein [Nitrosarchaeum sp.]
MKNLILFVIAISWLSLVGVLMFTFHTPYCFSYTCNMINGFLTVIMGGLPFSFIMWYIAESIKARQNYPNGMVK